MELKEYLGPLRKWGWLIIVATLLAGVTSYMITSQQPPVYDARAVVMIGRAIEEPNPTTAELVLSQQLASTYADIGKRKPVREATMSALGLTWLPPYNIRALANTQLVEIVVSDTSPQRAQVVANELANQLILRSPTQPAGAEQLRQEFVDQQLNDLQASITQTQQEILAKEQALRELYSAADLELTRSDIGALRAKLATLQGNFATLLNSSKQGALNSITVIEPATTPTRPSGPRAVLSSILAGAIGLVIATGAAYLLEYLDDTVKNADEISQLVGLPTLAGIAEIRDEEEPKRLITMTQPRSPVSEAFRVLRTGIQFSMVGKPTSTLLITSTSPAEGKSVTAVNLSIILAQAGYKVLLIDADLRRPRQHDFFGLNNERGLTSLLVDRHTYGAAYTANGHLEHYFQPTPVKKLYVLTSGPIPPNPSELLGSAEMNETLALFTSTFDFVVLDSPPVLAVTDAVVLSTQVNSVLMIVDAGRTRRVPLKQAVQRLREAKAGLVGVVLNRMSPRSDGYLYYYQNYSYLEDGNGRPRRPAAPVGGKRKFVEEAPPADAGEPDAPVAVANGAGASHVVDGLPVAPMAVAKIAGASHAIAGAVPAVATLARESDDHQGAERAKWRAPLRSAAPAARSQPPIVRRKTMLSGVLAGLILAAVAVTALLAYFATTLLSAG